MQPWPDLIAAKLGLCAILSTGIAAVASDTASAQTFAPTRYDDDVSALAEPANRSGTYEALKFIPLGSDSGSFLSLGGDERKRIEAVRDRLLGFRSKGSNAYILHRTLLFVDLHIQEARFFVQVGNHIEYGRAPAAIPTDIDRGDLQQAFLDYAVRLDGGTLTARGGRAEMAFDEGALIGLRDGTNVRQTWDGARVFYVSPELRLDLFAVRPVNVTPGYFDDRDLARQALWGVHADYAPAALPSITFNAFYYGNTMPSVNLAPRSGPEETHTFGLRARGTAASLDGSVGVIGQTGSFAGRPVAAFAAHADIGWTLPFAWAPRLGLRGDVLSGGDNAHGTVHTFNALYPNVAYSTEATVEAPANLIQPGLTLRFNPFPAVTVQCTLEGLWRYSAHDAFYAAPLFPLVLPDGSNRRYSGQEQQIEVAWRLNRFVTLTVAYAHFAAGAFIRAAHGTNQDFGLAQVAVHF